MDGELIMNFHRFTGKICKNKVKFFPQQYSVNSGKNLTNITKNFCRGKVLFTRKL